VQPRTSFRSPLFGLARQTPAGQKTRFRHRVLHPITLIGLIAFVVLDMFLVLRLVREEPTRPDPRPAGEIGGSQPGASSDPLGSFGETDIGTPIPTDEQVARFDRTGDLAGRTAQLSPPASSGSVATAPTSGSSTSSDTSGTGDGSGSTEPSESPAPEPDESGGGPGGSGSGGGDSGGGDGSGGGGGGGG